MIKCNLYNRQEIKDFIIKNNYSNDIRDLVERFNITYCQTVDTLYVSHEGESMEWVDDDMLLMSDENLMNLIGVNREEISWV